jgi:hypothetical protein
MLDVAQARRIATAYPPEAQHTPAVERETYMTETQQLAWLLRFDPEGAAEILSASRAATCEESRGDKIGVLSFPHSMPHHDKLRVAPMEAI